MTVSSDENFFFDWTFNRCDFPGATAHRGNERNTQPFAPISYLLRMRDEGILYTQSWSPRGLLSVVSTAWWQQRRQSAENVYHLLIRGTRPVKARCNTPHQQHLPPLGWSLGSESHFNQRNTLNYWTSQSLWHIRDPAIEKCLVISIVR